MRKKLVFLFVFPLILVGVFSVAQNVYSSATTPSITVISPNGGEKWEIGKIYDITWKATGIDHVVVDLYKEEKLFDSFVITSADIGKCSWTVYIKTISELPGEKYKIRVSDYDNPKIYDESDNYFSIVAAGTPSITVLSPNGGEVWTIGQTKRVSWSAANVNYVRIYIEDVSPDATTGSGFVNYIYDGAIPASKGYYDWTIQKNIPGSNLTFPRTYKIRIDGVNSPEIGAQVMIQVRSDNSFTIQETTAPSITTLSPNSGSAGTNVTVYGSGFNNSSLVLIGDNVVSVNPGYVSSDGTKLIFTFPAEALSKFPANVYSVRVSNVGIVSVGSGLASNYLLFQILSIQPSITVLSPNGGEKFQQGAAYQVKWQSTGITSGNVKITTCMTVASYSAVSRSETRCNLPLTVPNSGLYQSTFGQAASIGDYTVRVEDATNSAVFDESDAPFSIVAATTACADSDNGKSYYVKGTVSDGGKTYTDYCLDSSVLKEYFCLPYSTLGLGGTAEENYTCPSSCKDGACLKEDKLCTTEYNPVCGKDGKTYSNKCNLEKDGVGLDYYGECQQTVCRISAICEAGYLPKNTGEKDSDGCPIMKCISKDGNSEINILRQEIIDLKQEILRIKEEFLNRERNLVQKIDEALSRRLKGRILLQIEEKGEAWYV